MKKLILSALCIALLLSAVACGSKTEADTQSSDAETTPQATENTDTDVPEGDDTMADDSAADDTVADQTHEEEVEPHEYTTVNTPAAKVNKVINAEEMAMYNAIFFDGDTSYDNTEMTKTGIFTILYDVFNGKDRYYVWGYGSDEANSCWQWEFTVADPTTLPKVGSEITVAGKFVVSAAAADGSKTNSALDGRWIENATVTVASEYTNALCNYDLTTMSPILSARVQVPNILGNPTKFTDKICLYAKVSEKNMLVSPYEAEAWFVYDKDTNSVKTTSLDWDVHTIAGTTLPEVGTIVTVVGTFNDHGQFVTETLNIEG